MPKKKSNPKPHKCYELCNKELASMNAQLDTSFSFSHGTMIEVLGIPIRKIDTKSRKRLPFIACTYCPICGCKLEDL